MMAAGKRTNPPTGGGRGGLKASRASRAAMPSDCAIESTHVAGEAPTVSFALASYIR